MKSSLQHFLTFDLEHWYQGYRVRGSNNYHNISPRDHLTVEKLLRFLKKYRYSATFFSTGVFAKEFSSLIKEIQSEGHELASHSYDHDMVRSFRDIALFKNDLKRSIDIIENITDNKVYGFRAPKWSIPTDRLTIFYQILCELNLKYDSSVFPGIFSRALPYSPYEVSLKNGYTIWELPATTYSFLGLRIPVAGGLWFRLFPLILSRLALAQGDVSHHPQLIYLHPYDFDTNCPRPKTKSLLLSIPFRFARNYNLNNTYDRLGDMFQEFNFCSIKDWLFKDTTKKGK